MTIWGQSAIALVSHTSSQAKMSSIIMCRKMHETVNEVYVMLKMLVIFIMLHAIYQAFV